MTLYLTLSRGPRADLATPVLASSDPRVVNAVLTAISRLADPSDEPDVTAASGTGGWRLLTSGTDAGEEPSR